MYVENIKIEEAFGLNTSIRARAVELDEVQHSTLKLVGTTDLEVENSSDLQITARTAPIEFYLSSTEEGEFLFGVGNDVGSLHYSDENILRLGGGGDEVTIKGGEDNIVFAGAGDDFVSAWNSGSATVFAGAGDDIIFGGYGNDTLKGGAGDDYLHGNTGNDRLFGGAGNDDLVASSSLEGEVSTLNGGAGDDRFTAIDNAFFVAKGGAGEDTFVFDISFSGNVEVRDFVPGDDMMEIYLMEGQDLSFHQLGGNTLIETTGGGNILLRGVKVDLAESVIDVVFVPDYWDDLKG